MPTRDSKSAKDGRNFLLAHSPIELRRVKAWSKREGHLAKYDDFRRQLDRKSSP